MMKMVKKIQVREKEKVKVKKMKINSLILIT